MNIGENIRSIRKRKKLTLKALGIKVGLSEQAIGQYERGDRNPSIEILNKIAVALGVPINDILGYKDLEKDKEIFKEFYNNSIEFRNDLFTRNFTDEKIYNEEILSPEDGKVISNNKDSKTIKKDFRRTIDITVTEYEKESYELFKKLLISLGYDTKTASPYLFKKMKSQIELEINYANARMLGGE